MPDERPILLVDGMNIFCQAWYAFQAESVSGKPSGGYAGFLSMIGRYVREISPSTVYVMWEHRSAQARQKILPEYKATRVKGTQEERESRTSQLIRIMRTLKHTPVCQVYVEGCEGDDVIAYLARTTFADKRKVIVSTDKDFYQLLDEKTTIYSPVRKVFVSAETVPRKFNGILAENFAIFKSLYGDGSDNIDGIKGMGMKKIPRMFPDMLIKRCTLDDIYDVCERHAGGPSALYQRVYDEFERVKTFWSVIQLEDTILTDEQTAGVEAIVGQHRRSLDRLELMRSLAEDSVSFNQERFLEAMTNLRRVDH